MSEGEPNSFGFFPGTTADQAAVDVGLRTGASGTHTSRTIMVAEISAAFAAVPATAQRVEYAHAIIHENCLRKPTAATRKITNQRLAELYTLDPAVPLFRALRRLWDTDDSSHALLALLTALARDPLLRVTATAIIALSPGSELQRDHLKSALNAIAADRLKEAIIDKVVRNAASSWTQSGHLQGRTFKLRRLVSPAPAAIALALYLAYKVGFRGEELFNSGWLKVLDCDRTNAKRLALEAKRLGLIELRMAGAFIDMNLARLDLPFGRVMHGAR